MFSVLLETGAKVSVVKAGLLPQECLITSRRPIRLKVANGQYMVGGKKEVEVALQLVNHHELGRPDLGKKILLKGKFYEAQMNWDIIIGYDFLMESDSGVVPAQASMTMYQDDQLSWLSSPEHHVECQWIHPERHQLKVAELGTKPAEPTYQEYGVELEVAHRVAADLGASDVALDAFSLGTSAHLGVREVLERPSLCVAEALGSASRDRTPKEAQGDHPAKTGNTKPGTAAHGKRDTETSRHTPRKREKRASNPARKKGDGGTGTTRPGTGTPSKKKKNAKNTPRQPSQERLGTAGTRAQHTRPHRTPEPETAGSKRGAHATTHVP